MTIIVVNISSLPLNIDLLATNLRLLNFAPDIIGLTETRITDKRNTYYKPHLDNYVYYPSPNSPTIAGSAGIFVKKSLTVTERKDLDISVPGLFETVWLDIEHKTGGKKAHSGSFTAIRGQVTYHFLSENSNPPYLNSIYKIRNIIFLVISTVIR